MIAPFPPCLTIIAWETTHKQQRDRKQFRSSWKARHCLLQPNGWARFWPDVNFTEAKLPRKTIVTQIVLLFSKLQAFVVKGLVQTGLFPCNPPITPQIYANVTYNALMLIEMLLLCYTARYVYYVDLEREEETGATVEATDRSKDKSAEQANSTNDNEAANNRQPSTFTTWDFHSLSRFFDFSSFFFFSFSLFFLYSRVRDLNLYDHFVES